MGSIEEGRLIPYFSCSMTNHSRKTSALGVYVANPDQFALQSLCTESIQRYQNHKAISPSMKYINLKTSVWQLPQSICARH